MQYSLSYFLEVDKQPTVVDGNPSPNAIKLEEWRGLGANVDWLMSSGLVTKSITDQIKGALMPAGGKAGYDSHCHSHGQDQLEAYEKSTVVPKFAVSSICFREDIKVSLNIALSKDHFSSKIYVICRTCSRLVLHPCHLAMSSPLVVIPQRSLRIGCCSLWLDFWR